MAAKKFSEVVKERLESDMQYFFGEYKRVSNKYFTFKHFVDDDNLVIITSDITEIKGSPVLVTDTNKAVFLKDFQLRKVSNYDNGINAYAVKLNRKFFKEYTFKSTIGDFSFSEPSKGFETFVEIARAQDTENMKIRLGWLG